MKILIACGGTAGHIFPGLALAEELSRENNHYQIVLVISSRSRDKEYLKNSGYILNGLQIETLDTLAQPYQISPKLMLFSLRLIWALLKSFFLILKYSPDAVVGFGGYVSFAPLVMAHIFGIPTLIHEQNLVPGRANQWLAKFADRIAVSFNDTNKHFFSHQAQEKVVRTGFPLRRQILEEQDSSSSNLKKNTGKFTILVVGGSQGAHSINELVLSSLSLLEQEKLSKIHLVHLTGKADFHYVQQRYAALGIDAEVYAFFDNMGRVYRKTDLMISRSGAGTIFEAAVFGLPCILIPHSAGTQHQRENALFLQAQGCALVLEEGFISGAELLKLAQEVMVNQRIRQGLSDKIKMLAVPEAARSLKEQVLLLRRGISCS